MNTIVQVHMVNYRDGVLGNTSDFGIKNVVEVSSNTNNIEELTDTILNEVGRTYEYPTKMNVMVVEMDDPSQLNDLTGRLYNKMRMYRPYFLTIGKSQPILIEEYDVQF